MDRQAIQERFGIIGTSTAIRHVIERIRQVARTDISVVIEGESGVGKELVTIALHQLSLRRHKPHIIVNCGAIPEGLIESELFGAEKGAYTGATERRTGYFEDADGGTIFLDEIGEMPLAAQVRLLRVLESGQFSRVGSSTPRTVDVRVIAATNKNLAQEVQGGRFREDLFYRLSTVIIRIPPLRERQEDISPLLNHFLFEFSQKYQIPLKKLDPEATAYARSYHWPGNVRELKNAAEQATVLTRENIISRERFQTFLRGVSSGRTELTLASQSARDNSASDREREIIYRALLEMRLDMREMKHLMRALARRRGADAEDGIGEDQAYPRDRDYYVYEDERARNMPVPLDRNRHLPSHIEEPRRDPDVSPFIEDVPFELANGEDEYADEDSGHRRLSGGSSDMEKELPTIEEAERILITEALQRFEGNRRQTARALGISERTLYRKLKDMDLE